MMTAGTMYGGSAASARARTTVVSTSSPVTYPTRRPGASGASMTTAPVTPGVSAKHRSISPGSTRKPRTLSCESARPRYMSSHDLFQATTSPVR